MSEWEVKRCLYSNEPSNKVKVTELHWTATLVDGEFTASRYGSAGDQSNRVYTKAALSNVPEHVMVGWVQQALGPDEVDAIEAGLLADIEEQRNPTQGSIVPGEQ